MTANEVAAHLLVSVLQTAHEEEPFDEVITPKSLLDGAVEGYIDTNRYERNPGDPDWIAETVIISASLRAERALELGAVEQLTIEDGDVVGSHVGPHMQCLTAIQLLLEGRIKMTIAHPRNRFQGDS